MLVSKKLLLPCKDTGKRFIIIDTEKNKKIPGVENIFNGNILRLRLIKIKEIY